MPNDLVRKELSVRQRLFVKEYLVDLHPKSAAERAGYSKNCAAQIASFLLTQTKIRACIEKEISDRSVRAEVSAEYVLKGLLEVAQRCMQREPVMRYNFETRTYEQVTDEDGNNVWKFDSAGANRALELIGKHVGVFEADNRQRANVINVNILNDNRTDQPADNGEHPPESLSAVLSKIA